MTTELATLAGGCFWCLDACYRQLKGVSKTESGYADGQTKDPTYKLVCGGDTGHAEVVQITFDPAVVSYKALLEVFFTLHDPTTLNRQGGDTGTQYRSAIMYHSDAQKGTAEEVMQYVKKEGMYEGELVTQLVPYAADNYYAGEAYHQDYFNQNPGQGYCTAVVGPKVAKFRSKYMKSLMA